MALIAWYKLDGSLEDSVGKTSLTNSGTSTVEAGKIGQSMRKTSGYYLTDLTNIPDNLSISLWYKHNGATWASECIFGTRLGSNGFMLYRNASDTAGYYRAYFWYNSTSSTIVGYNQWPGISGLSPDTWYHLVMTRDSLGNFRLYKDGTLIYNGSPPSDFVSWNNNGATLAFHAQGNGSGYTAGDISFNDIRIYDHALSPKEVKELARAKILHYKFDDFQEPTQNILGMITPSYSKWGTNEGTSTYFTAPNGNQGVYLEITSFTDGGVNWYNTGGQRNAEPSAQYTVSAAIKYEGGTPSPNLLYLRQYRSDGTQISEAGQFSTSYIEDLGNGWYRAYRTFTTHAECAKFLIQGYEYKKIKIWIYDVQCEKKAYHTPYVANDRAGVIYDCSGYDNHAELALATTPRWVGNDQSKIGGGAYSFNGSQAFQLKDTLPSPPDQVTVSAWVKTDYASVYQHVFSKSTNVISCAIYQSKMYCKFRIGGVSRNPRGSTVLQSNRWYHLVWLYDGKNIKFYIDGELDFTSPNYAGALKASDDPTLIGAEMSGATGSEPMNYMLGLIDDIRVYATALSDEDILELYQTRGSIDSHGNLYVQEIVETGHKPLIADYTVWEDGQTSSTGLAPYFSLYSGGTSNSRILATDPWGKETVIWKSEPVTNTATGIYISTMPIDNTKTYRVSWWEKRVTNGDATQANYYFGLHGYGSVNGVSTLAGSTSTNFYFTSGSMTSAVVTSMLGEWNLMVGVVHPHDYTGSTHPDSGRYNVNGKIASTTDCKWLPETTTCRWRTYTIYRTGDGDSRGAIHYSAYPRVDILDGTEPSIQDLLNGFDSRHIDYVRSKGGSNPITLDVGDQSSTFGTIREVGLPVRYIRDWINGSTSNTGNHWVEIEAYSGNFNVALGKSATSPILTDGAVASSPYYSQGSGLKSVQVDLGEVYIVEVINVRHYYADGRTYHNTKTEVSADGVNWVTVFDSAIEGEDPETSAGNTIICRPQSFALGASGDAFIRELKEV